MIGKCNTGGGKSSGLYVWGKYNAVIGLGESTNNIALANDGTSIDTYVEENLYIKEDGTIGIQGEPYSTVAISSVMGGSFVGGMTPVKYCVGVDGNVYYSPVSNIEGSVDNCTAKPVSAVKSTFIEYTTNNNKNKYPEDGIQGGYYYEMVEDVTPEVTAQTPVITQILEGLVGKAQGANATADKILEGYSAYVGQELVEGTLVVPVDYGEITISEDTTEITVTHNLKRVPTKAVLLANGYSGDTYNNDFYPAVFINTDGLFTNTYNSGNTPVIEVCGRVYEGSTGGKAQLFYKTSLQSELTANTVKFTLKSSVYSSEEFKVGSYVWFVA